MQKLLQVVSWVMIMFVPFFVGAQTNWQGSGSNVYNTNTGNVGIGATTPLSKLDVRGSISYNGTSAEWYGNTGFFPIAANQVAYINLGDVHYAGEIEVSINGGWSNGSAMGRVTKRFSYYHEGKTGTLNTYYAEVADAFGNIANSYAIGDLEIYNSTSVRLPIYQLNAGFSNNINVTVKVNGFSPERVTNQISVSAPSTVANSHKRNHVSIINSNVGIGTTTPGTLLSLGNTGANTINLSATATSTFGSGINLRAGCFSINGICITGGSASLTGGVAGMLAAWTSASAMTATSIPIMTALTATSTTATSTFAGGVTGPKNFTIQQNSGYVGIGTNSPKNSLHVQGNFAGGYTGLRIVNYSDATGEDASLVFQTSSNLSDEYGGKIGAIRQGANARSDMFFSTTNDGGTLLERARITKDGNVGIGTTTPTAKLEVNGNIKISGSLVSDGDICIGKCQ